MTISTNLDQLTESEWLLFVVANMGEGFFSDEVAVTGPDEIEKGNSGRQVQFIRSIIAGHGGR